MSVDRSHWLDDIQHIIRSRHYTWLPSGLGGEDVDVAMSWLLTDIMHVCKRTEVSWETVLQQAAEKFEREEAEQLMESQDVG